MLAVSIQKSRKTNRMSYTPVNSLTGQQQYRAVWELIRMYNLHASSFYLGCKFNLFEMLGFLSLLSTL